MAPQKVALPLECLKGTLACLSMPSLSVFEVSPPCPTYIPKESSSVPVLGLALSKSILHLFCTSVSSSVKWDNSNTYFREVWWKQLPEHQFLAHHEGSIYKHWSSAQVGHGHSAQVSKLRQARECRCTFLFTFEYFSNSCDRI